MFSWLSDRQYAKLRLKILALEGRLDQIEAQHRALRSTFYATRGSPKGPPEPAVGSRQQRDAVLTDFLAGRIKHGA